jgi:hypothetical protein
MNGRFLVSLKKELGVDEQRSFRRIRFSEEKAKVHTHRRLKVGNLTKQSSALSSWVFYDMV